MTAFTGNQSYETWATLPKTLENYGADSQEEIPLKIS